MEQQKRIAMWSGPRNISTALLRSWGNRPDTFVTDEPLYAHYLRGTGLPHPGAEEVIRCHEADWRKVSEWLTGPIPEGKRIWYQKHMTHHLLPEMEREWLAGLTHCFLLRDPRDMLPSLLRILPEPTLADTGLPQQVELFDWVRARTGTIPPVIDSADMLRNPRETLARLCRALDVEFTDAMLSWPPGRRPTDGVWAKHWYGSVERSTSFEPQYRTPGPAPKPARDLLEQCCALYDRLYPHRLAAADLAAADLATAERKAHAAAME